MFYLFAGIVPVGLFYVMFQANGGMAPAEAFARGGVFVASCWSVLAVVWILRGLWRASRRVSVDSVARTAGALTSAAQTRAAQVAAAFKAGRGR